VRFDKFELAGASSKSRHLGGRIPRWHRFCRCAIAYYVVKEATATPHQRPVQATRSKDEFRCDRAAQVARKRIEC
jgi:hypothetical protein